MKEKYHLHEDWVVKERERGQRLDHFIWEKLRQLPSKKWIQRHVERNHCRFNGCIERFASKRLQLGDCIQWMHPATSEEVALCRPTILFESSSLLVCNKPPHISCDQSSKGILSHLLPSSSPLYLVHRLDRGTSGVLILAKSREKQRDLQQMFSQRKIQKRYWAITDGVPTRPFGSCTHFLRKKNPSHHSSFPREYDIEPIGKPAVMRWKLLQKKGELALLACMPRTGRTHQIRAQLALIQLPLLGESLYNREGQKSLQFCSRPLLHAQRITWYDPQEKRPYSFCAPPPL